MSEVEARPLLTRAQVEALRMAHVADSGRTIPTEAWGEIARDVIDAYLALAAQLAAVDTFAQDPDDVSIGTDYGDGHADGKNALRRELRAVRGIEASP